MSFDQGSTELENLLALSGAMLSHARRESWDDLVRFEGERREALTGVFSKPVKGVSQERLAEVIEAILEHDQEVSRLVAKRRDTLRRELEKLTRGKGAVHAYSTA
ncbi:MAG: flagellar protein FliT [Pseudomonadota bacterium]